MSQSRIFLIVTILFFLLLGATLGLALHLAGFTAEPVVRTTVVVIVGGPLMVFREKKTERLSLLTVIFAELLRAFLPGQLMALGMDRRAAGMLTIWVSTALLILAVIFFKPLPSTQKG